MSKNRPEIRADAGTIYDQAMEYHHAADVLVRSPTMVEYGGDKNPRYLLKASTTLTAFAVELYLKSLYAMENEGLVQPWHELNVLFDALSPTRKAAIERHWKLTPQPATHVLWSVVNGPTNEPLTAQQAIEASANTYVSSRYDYEGKSWAWYGSWLAVILRNVILEWKPDYGERYRHGP